MMIVLLQDYQATLQLTCEASRAQQYGWVNWTVAADTPDLVYYQSYYAYGLGWKIHVLDEGEEPSRATLTVHVLSNNYLISIITTIFFGVLLLLLL